MFQSWICLKKYYHFVFVFKGKKTHRGPTFKLSTVMVNAKSVVQAIQDLDPLVEALPADKAERLK